MVYNSENPQAFVHFPFYAFSVYMVIRKNTTSAYNESHLYKVTYLRMTACSQNMSQLSTEVLYYVN
jgi:hypothetical protein